MADEEEEQEGYPGPLNYDESDSEVEVEGEGEVEEPAVAAVVAAVAAEPAVVEPTTPILFEREEEYDPEDIPTGFNDFPEEFSYPPAHVYDNSQSANDSYDEAYYNSDEKAEERAKSIELLHKNLKIYVGLNLYSANLIDMNFDNKTFINCVFGNADFTTSSMKSVVMIDCNVRNVTLERVNLTGSFFFNNNFYNSSFINSNLRNIFCCEELNAHAMEEEGEEGGGDRRWSSVQILTEGNLDLEPLWTEEGWGNFFESCNFSFVNFSKASLKHLNLKNANFSSALLYSTVIDHCAIDKAVMKNTIFKNASIKNSTLSNSDFRCATFNNSLLEHTVIEEVSFSHVDFRNSKIRFCSCKDSKFNKAIFGAFTSTYNSYEFATMRECFFRDSVFSGIDDENPDPAQIDGFKEAQLVASIFINCQFKSFTFEMANLCRVKFIRCEISDGSNFRYAYLHMASFDDCLLDEPESGLFNMAYLDDDLKQYFLENGNIDNDWIPSDREEPVGPSCSILDVTIGEPIIIANNDIYEYAADFDGDEDLETETETPEYDAWNPALELENVAINPENEDEEPVANPVDALGNHTALSADRDSVIRNQIIGIRNYFIEDITLAEFMRDATVYTGPPTLRYMNFTEMNDLQGINFTGLDLTGTKFFGAILRGCNFTDCDLTEVNFQWADLIDVNFSNATFLGDYDAGGLFEGATIISSTFTNTILADRYNETTVIIPYSPRAYPVDQLPLPRGSPGDINMNAIGTIASTETRVKIKNFLDENVDGLVFRVIYGGRYEDFLITRSSIEQQMARGKLEVYPCLKPFNYPGPSYPAEGQTTYHDITRPMINVGTMVGKRVWLQKNIFIRLLADSEAEAGTKGIVFFMDDESERVPTFVMKGILDGTENYVSNLHCNRGAERETLWYGQPIPLTEGVAEEEVAAEDEAEVEADLSEPGSPAAFQGEYIDPYADESDTDSEPAALPIVFYNPPAEGYRQNIPPDIPILDIDMMGRVTKNGLVAGGDTLIRSALANSILTTTLVLRVVYGSTPSVNYLIKFNDLVNFFINNKYDAVPCRTLTPMSSADFDNRRRLINIGKIFGKDIYINKQDFMEFFESRDQVRQQRSYILNSDAESETILAVTPYKNPLNIGNCKGPIKLWNLDVLRNNLQPVEVEPVEVEEPVEPVEPVELVANPDISSEPARPARRSPPVQPVRPPSGGRNTTLRRTTYHPKKNNTLRKNLMKYGKHTRHHKVLKHRLTKKK